MRVAAAWDARAEGLPALGDAGEEARPALAAGPFAARDAGRRPGREAGCGSVRWRLGAPPVPGVLPIIGYRRSGWADAASRLAARTFASAERA